MTSATTASVILALGAVVIGCSDGLAPLEPCVDDQVVATVTSGTRPTLAWTPTCGMAALTVLPNDGSDGSGWALYTDATVTNNSLRSGIRWGNTPGGPGVIEPVEAIELIEGKPYLFQLYRGYGEGRRLAGYLEFTP